jgi:signal transduction histidine kinase
MKIPADSVRKWGIVTGSLIDNVKERFGVLPNFLRLASTDPQITANLWGFAQFGYLDNPMPSLFKERLFVYLSRFCEIRYCIARHVGFLVGLGRPAGDASCLPQTVEGVLPLLRLPLPNGDALAAMIETCRLLGNPMLSFPAPDSAAEQALFACATHVFLQTPDAHRAHGALRDALTPAFLEHLNVFLAFVRTAHYWTRLHPELKFEEDVAQLLATHEALAECVLSDPEAASDGLSRRIAAELASLRELRDQNVAVVKAYETLSLDHQFVEQRLRDQESNLRELVSVIPAAVYSCDTEGRIVYYNRQAVELWGCDPLGSEHPWSFLDMRRIFLPDSTPLSSADAPVKAVLATGAPVVNKELTLERPDSSRIDVLVNIVPLRDAAGRITGAVSIFQDVSELKRSQREREALLLELERSNKELSQFSHAVSHDLQAPVRSVRALTQLLVNRTDDMEDDATHLADLIEQASLGMERLIDSLLRYAQAGQGELNRQRVSVRAIVDAVRVSLSALFASTAARISCSDLPEVEADPVQLEQLFQNLIGNAIKYHRPGFRPEIEIRGEPFEDGWRFSVRDNGQGISPEHQELVFQTLKRLHGSDTPGSGLGLALCKTVVSRHGGRIWVESDGRGNGSTFYFTLAAESQRSPADKQTEIAKTA